MAYRMLVFLPQWTLKLTMKKTVPLKVKKSEMSRLAGSSFVLAKPSQQKKGTSNRKSRGENGADEEDEEEEETAAERRRRYRRRRMQGGEKEGSDSDGEGCKSRKNRANQKTRDGSRDEDDEEDEDGDRKCRSDKKKGKKKKKDKKRKGSSSDSSSEEELTEEELAKLKEAVEEKKKLIATLRNKPWNMKKKLQVLKDAQRFVEKFEGALGKGKGKQFYAYKVMMMKKWMKFQRDFENFRTACIPWEMKIKEIESHFGSSVASYFIFLRWMYGINIVLFGLTFGLVMVPEQLRIPGLDVINNPGKEQPWLLSLTWLQQDYLSGPPPTTSRKCGEELGHTEVTVTMSSVTMDDWHLIRTQPMCSTDGESIWDATQKNCAKSRRSKCYELCHFVGLQCKYTECQFGCYAVWFFLCKLLPDKSSIIPLACLIHRTL
ncbi:Transmembrane channel-like protein 2 [Varanus komodoensis]|nr:Transmembrane channel-like protein 2 [Varanus komodoensis]